MAETEERMTDVGNWIEELVREVVAELDRRSARLPSSTYRLQFHRDSLNFRAATQLVPYLAELGVSHVYASPFLRSRKGSEHCYDVVDHNHLHPDLGAEQEFADLVAALKQQNIGLIMDVVPNHMGVTSPDNLPWNDVLENGPSSPFADYFDIDWNPVNDLLENKVLLPILGEQYGKVLEAGQLRIEEKEGSFYLRCYDLPLPLRPQSYGLILGHDLDALRQQMVGNADDLSELESILTALDYLPDTTEVDPARIQERQREKEVIKRRIHRLVENSESIRAHIARNVAAFNGDPSNPASYDLLDRLLDMQVYRLSYWKAAGDDINYRRFFDINELAAVCMEKLHVFMLTHAYIFELLARGDVNGVRIDHIDGLYDPKEYLWRLQWGYVQALGKQYYDQKRATLAAPDEAIPWTSLRTPFLLAMWERVGGLSPERVFDVAMSEPTESASHENALIEKPFDVRKLPLYVVVEKILGPDEPLPQDWPTAGTTGYDFLNLVNGLMVASDGMREIVRCYGRFLEESPDFREIVHTSKLLILRVAMASELQLLAHQLNRLSERHRRSRDFTLNALRVCLREIMACFPVYRTYIASESVSERDQLMIRRAVAQAKWRNSAVDAESFNFVRDVMLLEQPEGLDDTGREDRLLFIGRFQQVTSPVMAKGIEDTSFYRYFPLISLNEVGGEPSHGGTLLPAFHAENRERQKCFPHAMLASSTHDTKRSEDLRARLNVLSEIPSVWKTTVNKWARQNRRHLTQIEGEPAPSRNDQYFLFQTLIGIWPVDPPDGPEHAELVQRVVDYMAKATHEAKVHTSWLNPNPDYDAAVRHYVEKVLERGSKNRFLPVLRQMVQEVADYGYYTAVAQAALKLTAPGVPDTYQGCEVLSFALVDPDNRRPVNFPKIHAMLRELDADNSRPRERAAELTKNPGDSKMKLFVTSRLIRLRREFPAFFLSGDYTPLEVTGTWQHHLVAHALELPPRHGYPARQLIALVPRLLLQMQQKHESETGVLPPLGTAIWGDTALQLPASLSGGRRFRNIFTDEVHTLDPASPPAVGDMLALFPFAVLVSE